MKNFTIKSQRVSATPRSVRRKAFTSSHSSGGGGVVYVTKVDQTPVVGDDGVPGVNAKPREYLYYLSTESTVGGLEQELDMEHRDARPSTYDAVNTDGHNPTNDSFVSAPPSLEDGKYRWATYRDYDTNLKTWGAFVPEYIDGNWAERGLQGVPIHYAGDFQTDTDYPYTDVMRVYVYLVSDGKYYLRVNQNAVYPTDMTGTSDSRWTDYWVYDAVVEHVLATKIDAKQINVDDLWAAILTAGKIFTGSIEVLDAQGGEVAGVNNNGFMFWSGNKLKPNFKVTSDGTLEVVNGKFNGVLSTTMKEAASSGLTYPYSQDIIANSGSTFINLVTSSSGGFMQDVGQIPFDIKYAGTLLTISNSYYTDQYGNVKMSQGTYTFTADSGMYFFENGIKKSTLTISREVVQLLGYGQDGEFYGWVVMTRSDVVTTGRYGEPDKVMFQGYYDYSSGTTKYKSYDPLVKCVVVREGVGIYKVEFRSTSNNIVYNIGTTDFTVQAQCYRRDDSYRNVNPTIYDTSSVGFRVRVQEQGDDRRDCDFNFRVYSTADWQ